ncbi:hypothetical protein NKI98_17750 [Mesorhizobium sp. M0222]|uniref:hypothetical protein n=1 Tax=Mesorhizobium sp. M0222 TaxID=2956921 RepID=UPI00333B48DA
MVGEIQRIEDALVKALRFRAGTEITAIDGDRIAYLYDYSRPSENGGNIRVEINLSRVARDMERELS